MVQRILLVGLPLSQNRVPRLVVSVTTLVKNLNVKKPKILKRIVVLRPESRESTVLKTDRGYYDPNGALTSERKRFLVANEPYRPLGPVLKMVQVRVSRIFNTLKLECQE